MSIALQEATNAIQAYTYGMDSNQYELATRPFAPLIDADYSQVGALKGHLSKQELQSFLRNVLDNPALRVHTAISQVFENPDDPTEFIAYFSARHFRGAVGQAEAFSVYGWYSYRLEAGKIVALTVNVQAMEGNPEAVLA
ncbi:nuclear transport factor 2 family protein [Hymenobacter terrenus]|uniref:nuclear transport factor 2 family protein n=1 Tax=Hymenobacter terrenus TaxID=1629124 RepID=UPI0006194B43|nr:nuclear transport factor 2 family protein [Hymenobacter terrenus]